MKYEIEKNIPIPDNNRGKEWSKWTFVKSLDNGDSFIIDIRQRNALYQYCTLKKIKIITRLCDSNKQQVRAWVYPQK